jgi:hypothetical protein
MDTFGNSSFFSVAESDSSLWPAYYHYMGAADFKQVELAVHGIARVACSVVFPFKKDRSKYYPIVDHDRFVQPALFQPGFYLSIPHSYQREKNAIDHYAVGYIF